MLCPACSHEKHSSLSEIPGSFYKCSRCGAIYGTGKLEDVVNLDEPMLANCNPEEMQYFSVLYFERGNPRRSHGWMERASRRVVQWG